MSSPVSPLALVKAMRPHQWTKNLFVFAPILFERHLGHEGRLLRVLAAFGIFCLLSSAVYLVNDVFDREADRKHPRKKNRPVASGALAVPVALVAAGLLVVGGLSWATLGLETNPFTAVCVAYVVIQALYTTVLKRAVVVDVLCISSGFVLRLLAGGWAAWSPLSHWIVLCTIFLSLFLALCKRRHEVVNLGDDAAEHRSALGDYPPALLDQLIAAATSATLVTYALYSVDEGTVPPHPGLAPGEGISPLLLTMPFVIYGMFRYLFLVYRRNLGGSPTTTLLKDRPSLVNAVLYAGAVMAVFRFASGG